jgi:hypothetical protein
MMEHSLPHTIALLTRTPAALNALLRDLPEEWTFRNEGENTWSVCDVVAHLIFGERTDWMPRARIVLQFGETQTFEPFDRRGHIREGQGKSLAQLLDEFARLRSESLVQLRALNLRQEDKQRIIGIIEDAGKQASEEAPIAWLRMEAINNIFEIRLRIYPGFEEQIIATTHAHAPSVHWLLKSQ